MMKIVVFVLLSSFKGLIPFLIWFDTLYCIFNEDLLNHLQNMECLGIFWLFPPELSVPRLNAVSSTHLHW